ncbi:expressed unknown protein [Seminavis robusta]|uniref:CCHC-type domain-containing protein n=1 Tax=Seminavis robusta TaxID=568900 RepID=A0A9N8ESU1_9STRA|nr:expressed unknown protein [Seminavis robusta]|eukprot:Sro1673_g290220.1 n/a (443) ;mRNA; r:8215-9543
MFYGTTCCTRLWGLSNIVGAFALSSTGTSSSLLLQQQGNNNGHHWQIHKTIPALRNDLPVDANSNIGLREAVLNVLDQWSDEYSGDSEWRSLLNKANLKQEVEESVVALNHLHDWRKEEKEQQPFIAVDACCGKGIFSTLLSYMAPLYFPGLTRIILFDKDRNIDWGHIQAANNQNTHTGRPFMELWSGINLHEQDVMVEQLLASSAAASNDESHNPNNNPMLLAITGIHLCKTLSPRLIGIVNSLGPDKAPYLCLAPCCLPRHQQQLPITLYEGPLQRHARLAAAQQRVNAKQRGRQAHNCYVCQQQHHVRDCPERQKRAATEQEWNVIVQNAMLQTLPCWKCGKMGHLKMDCTESDPLVIVPKPPTVMLDMAPLMKDHQQQHEEETPLPRYCRALAATIQDTQEVRVVDSGLTNQQHLTAPKDSNNWNRFRKSLFIVATR